MTESKRKSDRPKKRRASGARKATASRTNRGHRKRRKTAELRAEIDRHMVYHGNPEGRVVYLVITVLSIVILIVAYILW